MYSQYKNNNNNTKTSSSQGSFRTKSVRLPYGGKSGIDKLGIDNLSIFLI
jgi:hypothetical protein